jgi:hypothetical protein
VCLKIGRKNQISKKSLKTQKTALDAKSEQSARPFAELPIVF